MFNFFRKRHKEEEEFDVSNDNALKAYIQRDDRENSYKEASVTFPSGYTIRGIVVDHSEGGVRMRFQNMEALPEIVDLNVPALNIKTKARVAWNDTIDYGLEFLKPVAQSRKFATN